MFLYTDGITEAAAKSGELFGEARLAELLNAGKNASARGMVDAAIRGALEFETGAPQSDDITAMTIFAK